MSIPTRSPLCFSFFTLPEILQVQLFFLFISLFIPNHLPRSRSSLSFSFFFFFSFWLWFSWDFRYVESCWVWCIIMLVTVCGGIVVCNGSVDCSSRKSWENGGRWFRFFFFLEVGTLRNGRIVDFGLECDYIVTLWSFLAAGWWMCVCIQLRRASLPYFDLLWRILSEVAKLSGKFGKFEWESVLPPPSVAASCGEFHLSNGLQHPEECYEVTVANFIWVTYIYAYVWLSWFTTCDIGSAGLTMNDPSTF